MATRQALKIIKAAQSGEQAAQLALGEYYLHGTQGLPTNLESALYWLGLAADQESQAEIHDAQRLAEQAVLLIGKYIPVTLSPSLNYYFRAAALGSLAARTILAVVAFEQDQKLPQASDLNWLETAFYQGEESAAEILMMYHWHHGRADLCSSGQNIFSPVLVTSDLQEHRNKALFWHALSWPQPVRGLDLEICYQRGCLLLHALNNMNATTVASTKEDQIKQAELWLQHAAELNHIKAAYILGRCALGGEYSPIKGEFARSRYKQANQWLEMACQADNQTGAEASFALSILHRQHNFSGRQTQLKWRALQRSAQLGCLEAQLAAGDALWHRADIDTEFQALKYWQSAALSGNNEASQRLVEHVALRKNNLNPQEWYAISRLSAYQKMLGLRLEVGLSFQLKLHEFLLVDLMFWRRFISTGFLPIDVQAHYGKAQRRWVQIVRAEQKELLRYIFEIADENDLLNAEEENVNFRNRKLKFFRWCDKCNIPHTLFLSRTRNNKN